MVDYVAVLLLTTIVMAPFVIGNTDRIRLTTGGLNFTKCWTSKTAPQSLIDQAGGMAIDRLLICDKTMLGLYNGRWATLEKTTSDPGDAYRTTRRITVPVNYNGDPVQPWYVHDALMVIVFLALIPLVLARWAGQTPGRRLLKIAVQSERLSYGLMLKRECLKWGPSLIAVLIMFQLVPATLAEANDASIYFIFALAAAPALVSAIWWGVPLIFWRGAMLYDRMCGTNVVYRPVERT